MKSCTLLIIVSLILNGCSGMDEKIQGGWVVDKAFYNDQRVVWNLYSNGFSLKSDNTCSLPISDWSHRNSAYETGSWKFFKKNGKCFIEINTINEVFNRTFEIQEFKKTQDTVSLGFLYKMTLASDSLRLKCTKAIND